MSPVIFVLLWLVAIVFTIEAFNAYFTAASVMQQIYAAILFGLAAILAGVSTIIMQLSRLFDISRRLDEIQRNTANGETRNSN